MGKTYWITWGSISAALFVFFFFLFPLWMITAIVSLVVVPAIKHGKSKDTLSAKIDLLAKQAGIQYGTTEEKLEQLTNVRQSVAADARDPWDRT